MGLSCSGAGVGWSSLSNHCSSFAVRALCQGLMASHRYAGALFHLPASSLCTSRLLSLLVPGCWHPPIDAGLLSCSLWVLPTSKAASGLAHICAYPVKGWSAFCAEAATIGRGTGKDDLYQFMVGLIIFHFCKEAKPFLLLLLSVCGGINICWASPDLQARAITRGTGVLSSERFYFSQMWTCLQIIWGTAIL